MLPPTGYGPQPPTSGLVELLLEYTKDIASPRTFRLWTALHAIGSAAERRVWTAFGIDRMYPNLFVFLVGPPGSGKTRSIFPTVALLRKSLACEISPNDMTKQGLLDVLAHSIKGAIVEGKAFDYAYMACYISEITNFLPQYDPSLAGLLTDLWDCGDLNEESKRHGLGKSISFPGISLLIGAATESLGQIIPAPMWGSGFMARVILIYEDAAIKRPNLFTTTDISEELAGEIVEGFKAIGSFKGSIPWTPEAAEMLNEFHHRQEESEVVHSKLTNYNFRRWMQIGKLAMISAFSDLRFEVQEHDMHNALGWLLPTERRIPSIFRKMVNHEDGALLEEMCHQFASRGPHNPIRSGELHGFFAKRTAAPRVNQLIEVAVNADYLARLAGTSGVETLYVPLKDRYE